MTEGSHREILTRMMGGQAVRAETREMSPTRAFRRAVSRAAQATSQLEAQLAEFTDRAHPGNTEPPQFEDQQLCLSLAGPAGRRGLAVVDAEIIAALIEQQTTGRLGRAGAEGRAPTKIDAMFAGDFLNRVLDAVDEEFANRPPEMPWKGLRTAGRLGDSRAAGLWLADGPHRCVGIALDIGGGARRGSITMIVPAVAEVARSNRPMPDDWRQAWHGSLLGATAGVEALLYRFTLPLATVSALAPGMMIAIPAARIAAVALAGGDGRPVAAGRLGMANGRRAVRIQAGPAKWPAAEEGVLVQMPARTPETARAEPAPADAEPTQ